MPKHITVVLPNRPGALAEVLQALADANINIWTLHLANSGKTGFVQMVCLPHDLAFRVLRQKYTYYVAETDVIAVRLPNHPGALLRVLNILASHNINVSHAYDTFDDQGQSITLLEPEVPWETEIVTTLLKENAVDLVDTVGTAHDATPSH